MQTKLASDRSVALGVETTLGGDWAADWCVIGTRTGDLLPAQQEVARRHGRHQDGSRGPTERSRASANPQRAEIGQPCRCFSAYGH